MKEKKSTYRLKAFGYSINILIKKVIMFYIYCVKMINSGFVMTMKLKQKLITLLIF